MSGRGAVIVAALLLFAFFVGVDAVISFLPFVAPAVKELSSFHSKQIDIYMEMNKQLMALASFIFAGIGFLVSLHAKDPAVTMPRPATWVLAGSAVMSGASIYFGYLSYDKMAWMLAKGFFAPEIPILYWLRLLQFWSFVVSIRLFGYVWLGLTTAWRH